MNHTKESKPWFDRVPQGYWKVKKNQKKAITWLFRDALSWDDEDIKQKFDVKIIREHKLSGLYQTLGNKPYTFVDIYTNGRIKQWELKSTPRSLFNDPQMRIDATRWLFDEKLGWDDKDFARRSCREAFVDNGLMFLTRKYGTYELINAAYPGRFHPWEIKASIPKTYWENEQHCIQAVHWLFDEKLGWTDKDFRTQKCREELALYGFFTLLNHYKDFYELINLAYPNRFQAWEIRGAVGKGFWQNRGNRRNAVLWVMDKLDMDIPDFLQYGCYKHLAYYHLVSLQHYYKGNMQALHQDLFPEYIDTINQKKPDAS